MGVCSSIVAIIKINGYACERCNHEWVPRSKIDELPTICPKCKSPYWNKLRQTDKKKQIGWEQKKKGK